jgi:hypothetical protein
MQQQQHADYDLLAVFSDEAQAEAAAGKLHKEGFGEDEVYQLPAGIVGTGQFREHGPNRSRGDYFLQTQRTRPNVALVIVLAVVLGLVLGLLTFAASFALPTLPEPISIIAGVIVGIVIGAIVGLVRSRRVRGDIGQSSTRRSETSSSTAKTPSGARTVVAIRLPDTDNISRRSRARAILLTNGGKIDRSVGRKE